jgi:hypothetical protein
VHGFPDFNDQAGGLAPNVASEGSTFLITNGFERSLLTPPKTLEQLAPHLVYDLSIDGAEPVDIDHRGLEVQFEGENNVIVAAAAVAGSGSSDIIWLANLGAVGDGADGAKDAGIPDAVVGAAALAHDGGDAEVGIGNLYVEVTGDGQAFAAGGIVAAASGEGSKATALVGNHLSVSASGDEAKALAVVSALSGEKERDHEDDDDHDSDHESHHDDHHGVGGRAAVVLNDVTVRALASDGEARAELYIDASAGGDGGEARVSVAGDVEVAAQGKGGEAILSLTASGAGEVCIAGDITLDVQGDTQGKLLICAQDDGSSVATGDIKVAVGEHAHADVVVQFGEDEKRGEGHDKEHKDGHDHGDGEVAIGDLEGDVDGSLDVYVGELLDDAGRSATFRGEGEVDMELHEVVFGSIDVSELDGEFELELQLEDGKTLDAPHTTILGWDDDTDRLEINGDELDDDNVAWLGSYTDEDKMLADLAEALHGEDDYAFAVLMQGEVEVGVLAYDDHGQGITALVYLPEVDSVQELV